MGGLHNMFSKYYLIFINFIFADNCHVQVIHGLMYYPIINKWTWVSSPTLVFAVQAVKLNEDEQL